jgi:hypothetical protein
MRTGRWLLITPRPYTCAELHSVAIERFRFPDTEIPRGPVKSQNP